MRSDREPDLLRPRRRRPSSSEPPARRAPVHTDQSRRGSSPSVGSAPLPWLRRPRALIAVGVVCAVVTAASALTLPLHLTPTLTRATNTVATAPTITAIPQQPTPTRTVDWHDPSDVHRATFTVWVARAAGFQGNDLRIAVEIAGTESTWQPWVVGPLVSGHDELTPIGLWQIQKRHAQDDCNMTVETLQTAEGNARCAHILFAAQGWGPWRGQSPILYPETEGQPTPPEYSDKRRVLLATVDQALAASG